MRPLDQFLLSSTALTSGDLIPAKPVEFAGKLYKSVGELIMASKLTASYNPPSSEMEDDGEDNEIIEGAQEDLPANILDNTEKSLSCLMHQSFASALAQIFYKHYKLENVALGVTKDPLSDHTGAISVHFSEGVTLSGKERLGILEKLSTFLADLQNVVDEMDGMEIVANDDHAIFALVYEPATMGAALAIMAEQYAPSDNDMGESLRDASIFLERVTNFVAAPQMN